MSEKVLKAENFVADGICVMKNDIEGRWQVASVNQWVKNGNEIAELFASAPELLKQNQTLLKALKGIKKAVHEAKCLAGNNAPSNMIYNALKVAEAIQGEQG